MFRSDRFVSIVLEFNTLRQANDARASYQRQGVQTLEGPVIDGPVGGRRAITVYLRNEEVA